MAEDSDQDTLVGRLRAHYQILLLQDLDFNSFKHVAETTVLGYAVGTVSLMVSGAMGVAKSLPEGSYEPAKLREIRAERLAPMLTRCVIRGAWWALAAGASHGLAEVLSVARGSKDQLNFAAGGAAVGALGGFAAYPGHRLRAASLGVAFGAAIMGPYGHLALIPHPELDDSPPDPEDPELGPDDPEAGEKAPKPWNLPPGSQQNGWTVAGLGGGSLSLGAYAMLALYGFSRYAKFKKNRMGIEKKI